ncbi:MAG: hypothetical protein QNJ68_10355 [Microcoleaceae cyanobacterium MO_207.B10]|nr:hypothetical protein [Microcoleaceae cyanobacterium MO_207.B10]
MAAKNGGNRKPSSSWGNKILEELVQARGIDVDIKKDSNIAEILRLDRNQLHKIVFDNKHEIQILCPPEKISENINAAIMQYQITGYYSGNYDFEEWFEDFSYEFAKALPSTKQIPLEQQTPWGKDVKNRPKKLNLLTLAEVVKLGYQKIRFWRDREVETDSKILKGTYFELRQQLLNEMKTVSVAGGGFSPSYSSISFKGMPTVLFNFLEKAEDVEPGYTKIQSRVTIRLAGKTDDTETYPHLEKLTNSEVVNLANRIKQNFLLPEPYKIHRGKETVSCKDKPAGIDGYIFTFNQSDGRELFTKLYELIEKPVNLKRIFYGANAAPSEAYPTVPEETEVLGTNVQRQRRRPVGYVHFTSAQLFLSLVRKPIMLCDNKGNTYKGVMVDV